MPVQSLSEVQDRFFSLTLSSNCFGLPPVICPHGRSRKQSRREYAKHSMSPCRVRALAKDKSTRSRIISELKRLTYSKMSIEIRVTNCANYRFSIKKWHVNTVSRISISSRNTEVNNINTSVTVFKSQKHVSGLYIPVHKVLGVYILNRRDLKRNARLQTNRTRGRNTDESSSQREGGLDTKPTPTFFTRGLEINT